MTPEGLLPGLVLMAGAPLLVLLRSRAAFGAASMALPLVSWALFAGLPADALWETSLHGVRVVPLRLDGVSWLWATIFHVAAVLGVLYSLGVEEDRWTPIFGLMYAGAAIFAVTVGDLLSLFIGWELTGVFSVVLIWARAGAWSYRSGLRYLAWQVLSGVLLLAGVLWRHAAGLDVGMEPVDLAAPGSWLLLAGVGIKACFPGLHTWLTRAYPEATPGGTVLLSAFSTKMAIYALLRLFPGLPLLIPVGCVMMVVALVWALRADDIRRVLAYVLVNQLGFMVVGIGIGTPGALAGVSALAVVHILYKSLLFMATGAVLYRTKTARASALGDLGRVMPWTAAFYLVGAWSHLPGLAGYASKTLITGAAGEAHLTLAFLLMEASTAGVVLVAGVHLPWQVFGRARSSLPTGAAPAPRAMQAAMGLAALSLVVFGIRPGWLWDALPFAFDRKSLSPYHLDHMLMMWQLSAGAAFAYFGLVRTGAFQIAPRAAPRDADVLDRVWLPRFARWAGAGLAVAWARIQQAGADVVGGVWARVLRNTSPGSSAASTFHTRSGAMSMALMLTLYALLFFTRGEPVPLDELKHGSQVDVEVVEPKGGAGGGPSVDDGAGSGH